MKDDASIFGANPDNLDRLLHFALEPPAGENQVEQPVSLDTLAEKPGGRIDKYKLLRILGEGGMGIVYLAQQEEPVRREVALKVIKPGMDSKRVIARFEAEKQALALMQHPHIAGVYDAGLTLIGRPYFVMEYVKGIPITDFCDQHKLTIKERLELFMQVCQAVQHAHQKGIIHRDIKPSNILVLMENDRAIPKIIDFGVVKATGKPLTERTLQTEDSQLLGTPEYMSPEQADMASEDSEDIDTRSDIYSLGVLLYVLLTGVLPYESETLREGGIEKIRRTICETDPKTPSTRLISLGEEAAKVAEMRSTEIRALTKHLRNELEWIPLKAMRKERSERYRSVSELANDVENYFRGTPLLAGPPSNVYRLKKFVRRHQAFVTGLAAVFIVFMVGVVGITIFAIEAEQRRAEAQAVSDFLRTSVITSLSTYHASGREITNRFILDTASESLDEKLAGMPLAEASIRQTLAVSYWSLGMYEQAERHLRGALEIRQDELGPKHPDTLESMKDLGWTIFYQSRYNEAEQFLAKAVQGMKLVVDEDHWNQLSAKAMLAVVYYMQGRFSRGEKLHSEVVETVCRVLGEEHKYSPIFMNGLGWGYRLQGRYKEAEDLFTRGLEISRRVRGEQDWETLQLMHNLGELRWDQGQYDEAEYFLVKVLKNRRKTLGEEHYDTLWTMISLGWLYYSQERYDEAESLFSKAAETGQAALGDSHICSLHSKAGLGALYTSQGRYDEAEPLLEEVLVTMRRALGEESWITLNGMNVMAKLYTVQNRNDEAELLFMEALESRRRVMGNDHPHTLESMHEIAVLYKKQAQFGKAEQLLIETIKGRRLKLGDTHPHTKESINNLIDLYKAWNKPEKAEEWRAKLP
jgi:serine/threonine protein kinase/tetratricopeptide (TPR) repeat protein